MRSVGRGDRLRLARVARGLTQQDLATAAGVSRQAISGVEAGRFDPSLDVALAVADVIGVSVEELFADAPPSVVLTAVSATPVKPGARFGLAPVGARLVAFPLTGAATSPPGFSPALGTAAVHEASRRASPREVAVRLLSRGTVPPTLAVAGCDPAISLLEDPLSQLGVPVGLAWWPCSNRAARRHLRDGDVHVAALHRRPGATAPSSSGTVEVGFASWREGLAVARRLVPRVHDLSDVRDAGLRLANREPGSEARRLLDSQLSRSGVRPEELSGYDTSLRSHLHVAASIDAGLADVGVTTEPAALAHDLGFIPWQEEVTELSIRRDLLDTTEVRALLRVLGGGELRRQLEALPGYDASVCGSSSG